MLLSAYQFVFPADETEDAWREDISDIDRVIREILEQASDKAGDAVMYVGICCV